MKVPCLTLALFTSLAVAQKPGLFPPAFEKSPESDGVTLVADPSPPRANPFISLQIQVEYIELSHETLTRLLFVAEPKTLDATPLRKQLQELVGKNEAKVLETQIAVGGTQRKFTAESILEFIYPTEFKTPELPSGGKTKDSPSLSKYTRPMMPTAFDTRNTGSTLEVEPTAAVDGKLIDVRIVSELVWNTGNTTWLEDKDSIGNNYKVQMPNFYAMRVNTSLTCSNGEYTLVSVQSPKDGKGEVDMTRKVVVMLKCDVLTAK